MTVFWLTKPCSWSLYALFRFTSYLEENRFQHLTFTLSAITLLVTLPWTDKVITNLSSSPTSFSKLNVQQSWSDSYRPKLSPAETLSHAGSPPSGSPWNECSSQVSARLQSHIPYTFMLCLTVSGKKYSCPLEQHTTEKHWAART